jgi:hypothetical protein
MSVRLREGRDSATKQGKKRYTVNLKAQLEVSKGAGARVEGVGNAVEVSLGMGTSFGLPHFFDAVLFRGAPRRV